MTTQYSETDLVFKGQPGRPAEPVPELTRLDKVAKHCSPSESASDTNLLFCFRCGAPNDGTEFCPKCGARRCPTCGQ